MSGSSGLDFERLEAIAKRRCDEFASARPFPHVVIDDFLPSSVAEAVEADFARAADWKHYAHVNENKWALTDAARMPDDTRALFEALQSDRFRGFVTSLTGLSSLVSDPDLEGAGMHMTRPGGYLNVHTDFLTHTKRRSWRRQVNLLVYLNRDWRDEWDGDLELWTPDMQRCVESVAPVFNRCVVFHTIPGSYHGHPRRLRCPPHRVRQSLAIYYYEDVGEPAALASTDYRATPDARLLERALIAADSRILSLYTFVKGRTGISDETLTRWLGALRRDRR